VIKYKIRDDETGLYSSPGYCPKFTEEGHSWDTLGTLTAHLKLYRRGQYPGEGRKVPKTWTVVTVEVKESVVSEQRAEDLVKGYKPPEKFLKPKKKSR